MIDVEIPFRKIAVAVAFSPRCEALLAEAKLLQDRLESKMVFVHVGKKSLQEEQYLKHLLHRFGLDLPQNRIIWEEGEPVETILQVCQREEIDLLVAGALEKEGLVKYFLGGVSRKLSRRVKCSMLMLTEPSIHPAGFKHLVVEGSDHPKSDFTIAAAIAVGRAFQVEALDIIQETDLSKMALLRHEELKQSEAEEIKEKFLQEEDQKLEDILSCKDCSGLTINTERIEGKPGYVITKFAREKKADLLVLNSPDKQMGIIDRVFPHDIEYALADLPCNLLIVQEPNYSV
ncbi:MAG: universal stress protein [Bacteroidia bacterium]|nr:universal stress protein [Bacteroidia bacterium]